MLAYVGGKETYQDRVRAPLENAGLRLERVSALEAGPAVTGGGRRLNEPFGRLLNVGTACH